jgi:hypothetical protein
MHSGLNHALPLVDFGDQLLEAPWSALEFVSWPIAG